MATLVIPNTFTAGTVILSAAVNANNTAIINWASGNIQNDNLGSMTGPINWSVTASSSKAINITSSATVSVIDVSSSGAMSGTNAALRIVGTGASTSSGAALAAFSLNSPTATVPAVLVSDQGAGPGAALEVTSTTRGVLLPRLTTTQRTAITTPPEGMEIYNTTLKRKEIYNGTHWVASAGNSGQIVDWPSATVPAHMVVCDGSTLAVNATNAYAISVLGTTFGSSGQLPDLRGRYTAGARGSATARLNFVTSTNVSTTSGSSTITYTPGSDGEPPFRAQISHPGLPAGTVITAKLSATTFSVNNNATSTTAAPATISYFTDTSVGVGATDGFIPTFNGGDKGWFQSEQTIPAHTHSVTDPGHGHNFFVHAGGANGGLPQGTNSITNTGTWVTTTETTGITISATGNSMASPRIPPTVIVNKCLVL